jgi:hypothetical protein
MTVFEMTQLVCGKLPDGYEMVVNMENGCGTVKLYTGGDDVIEGDVIGVAELETQIVELVKLANEEPSMFDNL